MINKSLFTSDNQKWETPIELFDKLNEVFDFKYDLAAEDITAKCKNYYTPEDDAFNYTWDQTSYLNPPYGREQIKWIERAYEQSKKNGNTIVCLIPARPDTKIWHNVIFNYAKSICFIKGRLKFGGSKDSAPFPSALIIFSNNLTDKQIELLDSLGKNFVM